LKAFSDVKLGFEEGTFMLFGLFLMF